MATAPEKAATGTHDTGDTADAGAYEVLRDRLAAQTADLARRAGLLNARRVEEFGSARLELASTERLRTEHPGCPATSPPSATPCSSAPPAGRATAPGRRPWRTSSRCTTAT